ncbi:MAG: GNAT family N-acetyltransferase [Chloroflexales bacterium]|nr:GNAT family N-acetyltransferase [Chloroflexales bacterium]
MHTATLFADQSLARRVERSEALHAADYITAMEQLTPERSAAILPVAGGYAISMGAGFPMNRAVGLGLNEPISATDLDRIEEFYHSRNLSVEIELCPLADQMLVELLNKRGYTLQRFLNMLARPLIHAEATHLPPPAIHITTIGPGEVELWAQVAAHSSVGLSALPRDHWALTLSRVTAHRPNVTCFMAWIDNKPAGGAALLTRDGVATLFSASTLPTFRKRGVQAALIRARLAAAAAVGCDLATMIAAPGNESQRNMQRLGFQVVYTKSVMVRA